MKIKKHLMLEDLIESTCDDLYIEKMYSGVDKIHNDFPYLWRVDCSKWARGIDSVFDYYMEWYYEIFHINNLYLQALDMHESETQKYKWFYDELSNDESSELSNTIRQHKLFSRYNNKQIKEAFSFLSSIGPDAGMIDGVNEIIYNQNIIYLYTIYEDILYQHVKFVTHSNIFENISPRDIRKTIASELSKFREIDMSEYKRKPIDYIYAKYIDHICDMSTLSTLFWQDRFSLFRRMRNAIVHNGNKPKTKITIIECFELISALLDTIVTDKKIGHRFIVTTPQPTKLE